MERLNDIIAFLIQPYVKVCLGMFTSFWITFFGIPAVVGLAKTKNLFDLPNGRTSHTTPTPRLGGTMIFAGVIISSVLFTSFFTAYELKYIIAGMIILFFLGLKDDIVSLTPYKKLIGQILAALIMAVAGDIRLTGFDIFIQNDIFAYVISISITVFLILSLINSINLIDGIDGLAAGIGIVASIIFGVFFISVGHHNYSIICFSLLGALIAFFIFNVFGKKNKIFLGDTGSTIIGFLLAVFAIRFIELASSSQYEGVVESAPALAFSVMLFPIFDLLRIMSVRFLSNKPIFRADHNHLHHLVLRIYGSHIKSTLVILAFNTGVIILTYLFRSLGSLILIGLQLMISVIVSLIMSGVVRKRQ